ncbi:MAG: CbiX/SirB N-terminal domain-containing protein [Cyclobacteriaceae bacterium]
MNKNAFFVLILVLSVSFLDAQNLKTGVMVLAHGGGNHWNQMILDATSGISVQYPTEVAFCMALPRTMQEAIDKLESKGVERIVVVPLFISSHSFIIRQSEYLLGLRDVLADPPLIMDHSAMTTENMANKDHSSNPSGNNHSSSAPHHKGHEMGDNTLDQLKTKSKIIFTNPLDDHPLVAQIIYERIKELSTNPGEEIVILVGHGPNPEEDNKKWIDDMESIVDQVRVMQRESEKLSKMILAITVRDDADKAIYEQAKENLRNLVVQGSKQGKVIIVPLFLSAGGAEQKIKTRLEGLAYIWNGKTLLPDEKISDFILQSVMGALK